MSFQVDATGEADGVLSGVRTGVTAPPGFCVGTGVACGFVVAAGASEGGGSSGAPVSSGIAVSSGDSSGRSGEAVGAVVAWETVPRKAWSRVRAYSRRRRRTAGSD